MATSMHDTAKSTAVNRNAETGIIAKMDDDPRLVCMLYSKSFCTVQYQAGPNGCANL